MANVVEKRIVEEGPRNAVVKITGVLDSSDIDMKSLITKADCLNNDVMMTLTGFRVDAIIYSIGQVLDLTLYWNSNTPQQIMPLSKSGKIDATADGGFVPDTGRSGYDGSINLKSTGFPAGTVQNFTLLLRLIKQYQV